MGHESPNREYVPVRLDDRLLNLLDQEAKLKGTNRSAVIREVLWAALDPEKRRGESYGFYLKARDAEKARALLASLTLVVFSVGVWTLGFLATVPV